MPVISLEQGNTTFFFDHIIPPEAVEFVPSMQRSGLRGGLLVPGNYSICVQVIDADNPDHQVCKVTCATFIVGGYEVPQLIEPINFHQIIPERALKFRWRSVNPLPPVPKIVKYKVMVFESRKGQDPSYVVQTFTPIFEKFSDANSAQTLYWQPPKDLLVLDRDYVWTVQALDADGKTYGEPDGLAEPFVFRLKR